LEVKKVGEFTLRAEALEETIYGSADLHVMSSTPPSDVASILILSPLNDAIETQSNVLLLAQAPTLPNSVADIYLNGFLTDAVPVDAQGNIHYSLVGLREGKNTLLLSIKSLIDQELGKSEQIEFTYSPMQTDVFGKITLTPNTGLMLGDFITFDVETDDIVTSAKLLLDNGQAALPLDKLSDGLFTRSTTLVSTGVITLSLELVSAGQPHIFPDVATLVVNDTPTVVNVMMRLDAQDSNTLLINRSTMGAAVDGFTVKYGLAADALDNAAEVVQPDISFRGIDPAREYYFQIIPHPSFGNRDHGTATEVYVYSPKVNTGTNSTPATSASDNVVVFPAPSCIIQGIRVVTEKIGRKHYLVREDVE